MEGERFADHSGGHGWRWRYPGRSGFLAGQRKAETRTSSDDPGNVQGGWGQPD